MDTIQKDQPRGVQIMNRFPHVDFMSFTYGVQVILR